MKNIKNTSILALIFLILSRVSSINGTITFIQRFITVDEKILQMILQVIDIVSTIALGAYLIWLGGLIRKGNKRIMIRRQFQYTTYEGMVDVRFYLDFTSEDVISEIIIKSNFQTWLPERPTLIYFDCGKEIGNSIILCSITEVKLGDKYRLIYEYSPSYHTRHIITEFCRIIEAEKPDWFNISLADIVRRATALHRQQFEKEKNSSK